MFPGDYLAEIIRREESMGNSHECLECGSLFLAHSDGCPKCGNYARTKPLYPLAHEEVRDEDIEGWYLLTEDGLSFMAVGESSPWPRVY